MEYYWALKEWNKAIFSNIDGSSEVNEVSEVTEWSKSDREGEISYDIPYTWNLKRYKWTYKTERDSQT